MKKPDERAANPMNTTPNESNYQLNSEKDIPESGCHYGLVKLPGYQVNNGNRDMNLPVSRKELPAIGTRIKINFPKLGTGCIVAYFTAHGFIGVEVKLDIQPGWYARQHGPLRNALIFSTEFTVI